MIFVAKFHNRESKLCRHTIFGSLDGLLGQTFDCRFVQPFSQKVFKATFSVEIQNPITFAA